MLIRSFDKPITEGLAQCPGSQQSETRTVAYKIFGRLLFTASVTCSVGGEAHDVLVFVRLKMSCKDTSGLSYG